MKSFYDSCALVIFFIPSLIGVKIDRPLLDVCFVSASFPDPFESSCWKR